jgi:hypothetical protein
MTDEELQATALPLLQELVKRQMLVVSIDVPAPPGHSGMCTTSAIVDVIPNGLTLDCQLEDDAQQIAVDAQELWNSHKG